MATQKAAITAWWEVRGDVIGDESRIHRSLEKDAPFHRTIERLGVITSRPILALAAFITNIAASDFRYTHLQRTLNLHTWSLAPHATRIP